MTVGTALAMSSALFKEQADPGKKATVTQGTLSPANRVEDSAVPDNTRYCVSDALVNLKFGMNRQHLDVVQMAEEAQKRKRQRTKGSQ